ncbi:MAG: hypothetical protein D6812_16455 [Deltaproteobacteria bacterium]|nr:MAG: hypothetical protein D6812_16455 [Deltaproteobacteria bacterium]
MEESIVEKSTNRKGIILHIALVAFMALAFGCGGDDDETSSAGSGNGNGEANVASGLFSALVSGNSFDATGDNDSIQGTYDSNLLAVSGFDFEYGPQGATIMLAVNGVTGPGTYTIEAFTSIPLQFTEGTTVYSTAMPGSSGTITVSSVSETGAKGTFEFTAFNTNNDNTSVDVTDGVFDVTF